MKRRRCKLGDISMLADVDPTYSCKMLKPTKSTTLHSTRWTSTIRGWHFHIPTRELFLTEHGIVYVVKKRRGNMADYVSLDSLIEAIPTTKVTRGMGDKSK